MYTVRYDGRVTSEFTSNWSNTRMAACSQYDYQTCSVRMMKFINKRLGEYATE